MHAANNTAGKKPTSEAAIFARLWETANGNLPRALARHILKLGFPAPDRARMHELAVKNQEGRLSPEELEELDSYVKAGDLLALLQAKARRTLRRSNARVPSHG